MPAQGHCHKLMLRQDAKWLQHSLPAVWTPLKHLLSPSLMAVWAVTALNITAYSTEWQADMLIVAD